MVPARGFFSYTGYLAPETISGALPEASKTVSR